MTSQIREFKLQNLIKEVVTLALYEQALLREADPGLPPQPPQGNAGPVPPPPTPPPAETAAVEAEQNPASAPSGQPLTVDSMIERMNVIRGGRSFTDPEIYGQFVTYFKKLTPEQLQTIDQYLQDVSKIVVNVEQQGGAQELPPAGAMAPQNNSQPQPPISANPGAAPPAGGAAGALPGI